MSTNELGANSSTWANSFLWKSCCRIALLRWNQESVLWQRRSVEIYIDSMPATCCMLQPLYQIRHTICSWQTLAFDKGWKLKGSARQDFEPRRRLAHHHHAPPLPALAAPRPGSTNEEPLVIRQSAFVNARIN